MSESNHSGQYLENTVKQEFISRGFFCLPYSSDVDNQHLFEPRRLVLNAPYTSLYGCDARSEFVGIDQSADRRFRIECRFQGVPGSVDEKFPYLLRNAAECMPENEVIILIGGDGARKRAVSWAKAEAKKICRKRVEILSMNEFMQWVKQFPIPRREAENVTYLQRRF